MEPITHDYEGQAGRSRAGWATTVSAFGCSWFGVRALSLHGGVTRSSEPHALGDKTMALLLDDLQRLTGSGPPEHSLLLTLVVIVRH